MRKIRKQFKVFVSIVCLVSILGNVVSVSAEDKLESITPEILQLKGSLSISTGPQISPKEKFLLLGLEGRVNSVLLTPFDTKLVFPVVDVLADNNQASVRPSAYILGNLDLDFRYWSWNLAEYPQMQLPEASGYVLHVGDTTGQPDEVRWGIRKTGIGATGKYPLEHVLEYRKSGGEWVRAITRGVSWSPPANDTELWGAAESTDHGTVYWERIPNMEHWSPIVDGVSPELAMAINENNIGIIDDILIRREETTGNDYDLVSGIRVTGAVTNKNLRPSNAGIIPEEHFKITHNMTGISGLITGNKYTAVGRGEVVSTVTDYEDDVTIFTQEIIVSSTGKTGIDVYFAGTDMPYQGEWMSNDESADELRQGGLAVQANSTINGTYDLMTMIDGNDRGSFPIIENSNDRLVTGMRQFWNDDQTTEKGIPVTSRAYLMGSRKTMLAKESDAQYIRSDSTVPTINEVYPVDDSWAQITGTDADDKLSQLETKSGGVYYKFVKRGVTTGITTPKDGKDWTSLKEYKLLEEAGEYDLYVYAKDNATNRSESILANKDPIIVSKDAVAKICLEKIVGAYDGTNQDIFLIHVKEGKTTLGSVALKQNETSKWMTLPMNGEESRKIEIVEVVPMDYAKEYRLGVTDSYDYTSWFDKGVTEITVQPDDEIKITIDNTFTHTGYFRGKDAVKNLFE